MTKPAFFITGTDTDVGKTFIAIGLLKAMKEMGHKVCPMKPVETGCGTLHGRLIPADALELVCAAKADEPLNLINPYRFKPPVAPAVAAELAGIKIDKKKIFSAYKKIAGEYDITIVEVAGGIMVPVWKKYLFIDLVKDLKLPVLIVSRPGLGTINHTLLTIDAARSRGIGLSDRLGAQPLVLGPPCRARDHPLRADFGTQRMVRDLLCIPGRLEFREGKLCKVALLDTHPYAPEIRLALGAILAQCDHP